MKTENSLSARARKTFLWGLPILLVIWIIIKGFVSSSIYNAQQAGWEKLQDYKGHGVTTKIVIDDEDRAWIGYMGYGVGMWDGEKTTIYNTSNSEIGDDQVLAIFVDTKDNLWVGTEAGLSVFDGKEWVTYATTNSKLASNKVTSIAVDQEGRAWIGTDNGVSVFTGDEWKTYTTSNSKLLDNGIGSIAIALDGATWIGTGGGISIFDQGEWINFTPENSNLSKGYVTEIVFDQEGRAWVGVWGASISVYDGENWINYTAESPGLAVYNTEGYLHPRDLMIEGSAIDPNGKVWIGTSGRGVSVWDGATWTTYTYENSGLNSYGVYDLAAFSTGEILIDTPQGSPWIFSNEGQQPVSPSLLSVYDFFRSIYSNYCVLPLIVTLWLAIVYSMLKHGEIEYRRYLGKFPNFKIETDNFIKGLPKFRVVIGYIGLGFIGAVLALLGFYLYCSVFSCGDEWGLALIIFSIPAVVAGSVYGFITGGISRKWWGAFFGGIIGGAIGFLYFPVDEAVVWLGVVIGAPLGFVFGKGNRVWSTLLGGIIGFSFAIICGVIFGW